MIARHFTESLWRTAVALAVAVHVCACQPTPKHGDIVLVTVDTLRADHMGSYGYSRETTPRIDAFFSQGTTFDRAYATSSYTTASVVSLLGGLLPQDHGVRLFDQLLPRDAVLITELLPDAYETAAFISNGVLSDSGLGIASRFDHFDDELKIGKKAKNLERRATPTTDAALAWMKQRADPDRPLFLWVHYMDPHAPYDAPSPWNEQFDRSEEGTAAPQPPVLLRKNMTAAEMVARVDDYDREIAYVDTEVGRLLDAYAKTPRAAGALTVFTADHGEALADRPIPFQHAYQVYEELIRVPFMMRGPAVASGRSSALISGVDLLPTLLAFVEVALPAGIEGRDLRDAAASEAERVVFAESVHNFGGFQWRAAVANNDKWVVKVMPSDPLVREQLFYDLDRDPRESVPAAWPENSSGGQRLLELVDDDPDPAANPSAPERGGLTEKHTAALRAMGYIE